MEFGVCEVLPNYSGGLGVLAGDHLKAASDLGLPLIGVGLLYRSGYFRQSLSLDGWQLEHYPVLDPQGLPLQLLVRRPRRAGEPVLVEVAMPAGRPLKARVWQAAVGRVPLLLLDSDIEENDPDLRGVTDRLYGGDQDQRIRQEILVGIGGVRAVRAYCAVTGHPQPGGLPHQRGPRRLPGAGAHPRAAAPATGLSFDEALAAVRAGTVFTTHTPVPAGIDRFPVDMVRHYFRPTRPAARRARPTACSRSAPRTTRTCSTWRTWACGWPSAPTGCRGCTARCRAACSAALWEGFDADEVPIGSVTNGVHGHTWEAREVTALLGEPGTAPARRVGRSATRQLWDLRGALRAPAGRRGAPPGAGGVAAARRVAARSWAGPSTSSTRTCSPSGSPAACRPTSGSR